MDNDQQPHQLIAWEETAPSPALPDPALPTAEPVDAPDVAFLTPHHAHERLFDSVVYRPGALVAVALLVGPVVCAIAGAIGALVNGEIPIWLPLLMLLWLPALALAWALLKSVRVTADTLACGRPLSQWRDIAFRDIEHVEQRGLRLVVRAHDGASLAFTPLLLHRGSHLRRSLLLRLPLPVLSRKLRAQAQALSEGDLATLQEVGDVEGVLTVRPRLLWSALAGGAAVALLALAGLALWALALPLSVAPAVALVALACALGFLCLWMAQDIFVSEKGLLIHFRWLRRERDVFWAQVGLVEYSPWEMALVFRSAHTVVCAGPGLLTTQQARLMRRYISRYSLTQVGPLLPRLAQRGDGRTNR